MMITVVQFFEKRFLPNLYASSGALLKFVKFLRFSYCLSTQDVQVMFSLLQCRIFSSFEIFKSNTLKELALISKNFDSKIDTSAPR